MYPNRSGRIKPLYMKTTGLSVIERKEGIRVREDMACGLDDFRFSASLF